MHGLFVTGTDTGVGKTVLSAALLSAMSAAGEQARAYKPVLTGIDEQPSPEQAEAWPADHELLGRAAGMSSEEVAPLRYGPAVSPHLAAELAGEMIDPARLIERANPAGGSPGTLIVEGVGGLLTPLTESYTVCDLAAALGLPLLIAARPGLGTINHSMLTIQAARSAGLELRAVVLTPWPERPSRMQQSNLQTIARASGVEVHTLGFLASPDPQELARAGARLPWRHWLEDV